MAILLVVASILTYVWLGGMFWAIGKRALNWEKWGDGPGESLGPIFWPVSLFIILVIALTRWSVSFGEWLAEKLLERKIKPRHRKIKPKPVITSKNYHELKSLITEYEKNLPVMERV